MFNTRFYRNPALLIAFIITLLSGCATQPTTPNINALDDYQLMQWLLKGKVGVRSDNFNGIGSLYWQQTSDAYDVKLTAPLGVKSIRLTGNAKTITIKETGKAAITVHPSQLERAIGLPLPVTALPYWATGRLYPNAATEEQTLNNDQQLEHLQQMGWHIHYQRYNLFNGISMPSKLVITRDKLNTKITIVVKDWQLPSLSNDSTNTATSSIEAKAK